MGLLINGVSKKLAVTTGNRIPVLAYTHGKN